MGTCNNYVGRYTCKLEGAECNGDKRKCKYIKKYLGVDIRIVCKDCTKNKRNICGYLKGTAKGLCCKAMRRKNCMDCIMIGQACENGNKCRINKDLIITEEQLIILTDNFLEIQSRIVSINNVLLRIGNNKND